MKPNVWNENRSVVVPAISAPSSVACLRSLGARDVRTIAVSADETTPAFRSAYCDESVLVPSPHDDLVAYKDALCSLAMRPDVSTIIPVREEDVYVLAAYRDEFADHVATPWPTLETLSCAQDRIKLFNAAERANVAVPETGLLATADGGQLEYGREREDGGREDRGQNEWTQEWIVKPRFSILTEEYVDEFGPETCIAPPSTTYLRSGVEPDVAAIEAEMNHTPLLQEYVPSGGDEYGFFALYDHGEPLATFQHRQRRGWSYAGGPSAYRESVRLPGLERSGRALLDELEWHGLAMVEFLRDEEAGEFKLMEVNPRFWSSLPFSVRTGADFPYYYWQLAQGKRDEIDHSYEVGIGGHLLRGELLYLHSVLTDEFELVEEPTFSEEVTTVLRSILEEPRFDYLRLDDPRPFVRDLLNTYTVFRNPSM